MYALLKYHQTLTHDKQARGQRWSLQHAGKEAQLKTPFLG